MIRVLILALAAALLPGAGLHDAEAMQRTAVQTGRGWLGIAYVTVAQRTGPDVARSLVIRDVVDDSPARRAGLMVDDTIVTVNGLRATEGLMASLALAPGDTVRLRIRRAGIARDVAVIAAPRPAGFGAAGPAVEVFRFDGDSLRAVLRTFVDSARLRIDSLRLPALSVHPFVYDSVAGAFHFRTDSLPGMREPFVLMFRPGDSLRWHLDSARFRLLRPGGPRVFLDSVRRQIDFALRDSMFALGPDRFGVVMAGMSAVFGAEMTRLDPALGRYFGTESGVLVTRVPAGSPAERAGLRAGDVIQQVNDRDVASVEALRAAVLRAERGRPIRLQVLRERRRIPLEVRP
jgi:membrane-associated protease RseP (regulator of RpoE activity)